MGAKSSSSQKKATLILAPLPDMYTMLEENSNVVTHPELPSLKIHTVLLNKQEGNKYEKQLEFRKNHKEEFVEIMYGELLKDQNQYLKAKVYVEQIVVNLQQLSNIHFFDMMAIFHQVFRGFKLLFEHFGAFVPDPRMIGFNEAAKTKVWANTKFSKSYPKISYQMIDQPKMVSSLVEIFMNKVDIETLPIDSHRRKFHLNATNFQEAIELIEGQVQSETLIPKTINSIKNLLVSGRKIHENQIISMNSEHYLKKLEKVVKFSYSQEKVNKIENLEKKNKQVNFSYGRQPSGRLNFSVGNPEKRGNLSAPKVKFTSSSFISPVPSKKGQVLDRDNDSTIERSQSMGKSRSLIKFSYDK